MGRTVVAANWKMHKTAGEARTYVEKLLELVPSRLEFELIVFPSATALYVVAQVLRGSPIAWGAQNAHWETQGAYTGEISVNQVADLGAAYVLCGHSERRHLFGEDDATVAAKVRSVLAGGLVPVLCVGETLEQRRGGDAWDVVTAQLSAALKDIGPDAADRLVVAYEPVWAIGTGVAAQPEDAQSMAHDIRSWLTELFGSEGAEIPVQYGGSVKPNNADAFLQLPDVDGALVGGASLDPKEFWTIACSAVPR